MARLPLGRVQLGDPSASASVFNVLSFVRPGGVNLTRSRGPVQYAKVRAMQPIPGCEADKVMLTLLKDLYHGPYDAKELVILQEIYEMVEQAVDRCRNAGNIVVQIVLKHS